MAETNPNGANQFQLDPRQKLCWDYYINPKSETFSSVTNSARKAGYEESYCDTISQSEWFCAKLWRLNASFKGEQKLKELLEIDMRNGGEKVDVGIARIQADIAKLLVTTQGKEEGWSTRTELTGPNGKELPTPIFGNYAIPNDHSDEEGDGDAAKDTSRTGRDFGLKNS